MPVMHCTGYNTVLAAAYASENTVGILSNSKTRVISHSLIVCNTILEFFFMT